MGIVLGDLREVEKEVVVLESPPAASPYTPPAIDGFMMGGESASSLPGISPNALSSTIVNIATDGRLFKVIKKYEVQILCTQHNPVCFMYTMSFRYDFTHSYLHG